jgi:hypothetical protein
VLVLVLSIDREPWRSIEREGQRRTWAAPERVPGGCRVVFYYGRGGAAAQAGRVAARLARARVAPGLFAALARRSAAAPSTLVGDRLLTRVPDAYAFTLPKLLAALRWAASGAAGAFDYVYRTNTSSYVNLARLREVAAGLPADGCYAGFLGRPPAEGPPFVKGAGLLLGRDLVEAVAANDRWGWGAVDDAALGAFLAARGVEPIPLPRVLVHDPAEVAALSDEELRAAPHFRCKSRGATRSDALTMAAIHARVA